MTKFGNRQGSSLKTLPSGNIVELKGIPFSQKAAQAFRRELTPHEQVQVLRALSMIQLQAIMRPQDEDHDTITVTEARFSKVLVRYSQHRAEICVLNFKILTTSPKVTGLHILSNQKIRIRDGTQRRLRCWRVHYRSRAIQRLFATSLTEKIELERTDKWLERTTTTPYFGPHGGPRLSASHAAAPSSILPCAQFFWPKCAGMLATDANNVQAIYARKTERANRLVEKRIADGLRTTVHENGHMNHSLHERMDAKTYALT